MNKILILMFPLLLIGCSDTKIITKGLPCSPPSIIMDKSDSLTQITVSSLSMKDMYLLLAEDAVIYNTLKDKHEILTKWIREHCEQNF